MGKGTCGFHARSAIGLIFLLIPATGVQCDMILESDSSEFVSSLHEPSLPIAPRAANPEPSAPNAVAGAFQVVTSVENPIAPPASGTPQQVSESAAEPANDAGGGAGTVLSGTPYFATLTYMRREVLDETREAFFGDTQDVSVWVADSDELIHFEVVGFVQIPTVPIDVAPIGEVREYSGTTDDGSSLTYTLMVTTRSLQSSPGSAALVVDIAIVAEMGNLDIVGSGVHELTASWANGTMTYDGFTRYDAMLLSGAPGYPGLEFDAIQEFPLVGMLTRQ